MGNDSMFESAVESVGENLNTAGTKDIADITSYIRKATVVACKANLLPSASLGPDEHHTANWTSGGNGASSGSINAEFEMPAKSYCVREVGDYVVAAEVVECALHSTCSHDIVDSPTSVTKGVAKVKGSFTDMLAYEFVA